MIEPVQIPDLNLQSLDDEDRAKLDSVLAQLITFVNDIIKVVNVNHP